MLSVASLFFWGDSFPHWVIFHFKHSPSDDLHINDNEVTVGWQTHTIPGCVGVFIARNPHAVVIVDS